MMLSLNEINQKISELKDWSLEINSITKLFELPNSAARLDFVTKLENSPEEANHHPDIVISYNRVKIVLTTHIEGGLTEKDFALAKR
jgi:4a-hydroxytetrahydrobiopterin dehydratase